MYDSISKTVTVLYEAELWAKSILTKAILINRNRRKDGNKNVST